MLRDRPDFFMSDSQEPKRYRSLKENANRLVGIGNTRKNGMGCM